MINTIKSTFGELKNELKFRQKKEFDLKKINNIKKVIEEEYIKLLSVIENIKYLKSHNN